MKRREKEYKITQKDIMDKVRKDFPPSQRVIKSKKLAEEKKVVDREIKQDIRDFC